MGIKCPRQHTTLVDNKFPNLLIVVDGTVIHNDNTSFPWERVQLRSLYHVSTPHKCKQEDGRTTCLCKNCKNLSLFTEPSKMSNAMIPSEDSAGRIE